MTRSMLGSGSSSSLRGLLLCAALLLPALADAKVFYSREEAVRLAFPDADRVEDEVVLLDDDQLKRIEELSRSKLDTRVVRVYRGYREDALQGYAFIDVHNVRTQPEAFLVVLSPDGQVRSLRVLAFHEPIEYMPSERWYEQFRDKSLREPLRLGGDVHGIVGATLSAQATTQGVRRALAFYAVMLRSEAHASTGASGAR